MPLSERFYRVNEILERVRAGGALTEEEIALLYALPAASPEAMLLRLAGAERARALSGNMAEVHAQIGLDAGPCTQSCRFCSFSRVNTPAGELRRTPLPRVLDYAGAFREAGANLLLLMTSAPFPLDELGEICLRVREAVGPDFPLLANTRDLSLEEARTLRRAGFNGAYHAARMGEGTETDLPLRQRLETLHNLNAAGLPLSVCIEPIGEEHTAAEFAEKTRLHLAEHPLASGVGRRIPVPGSAAAGERRLTQPEQAVLIALYRLLDPATPLVGSANATIAAEAGANLCWAEAGYNPRDRADKTELDGTGRAVETIARIYAETGWELRRGPSPGWNMGDGEEAYDK